MKRSTKNKNDFTSGDEEEEEEENMMMGHVISASSSRLHICCQAENCPSDMTEAKCYHRRHKVCEYHAKAPMVRVNGLWQRFCQQCSRFHEVTEFDEAKRSCRRRLAGHNQRRRKSSSELK